jgi:uncharacterized protein with ParB-like and HNH nuclease domain/predicted transport protein
MKATEAKLLDFLKKSPQFVIPIYQRTYSWTQKECRQLWDDIIRCGKNDKIPVHFIGSIVYVERDLSMVTHQAPLLVIDGQQRVTSLSLLLAALAEVIGETEPFDGFSQRKIRNYYLLNPEETGDRHFKLLLSQTDKATLTAIVGEQPIPENHSLRIVENYGFFKAWIKENGAELATICKGLAKLVVVDIALNRGSDNPQLIFESMNSTGKELSQADLIRNFVLMGLESDLQNRLYESYWHPMELEFGQEAYGTHFDNFMRHYLTVLRGEIPNLDAVYDTFKAHARDSRPDSDSDAAHMELLVSTIRKYAHYFCALALGGEKDPDLKRAFADLRELKVDVAYPFLLELYHDYAEKILNKDDFIGAVRWIEAYVFRRAVCSIPTNSMNKTFATFGKSLKKDHYLESIAAHFILLPSYRRFPGNEEFQRGLQIRDLYRFRNRSYWLRRLENYGRKEPIQVDEFTIEHIMPQNENLSSVWKSDLGSDWEQVHKRWLHTLGNLTLTGYNSEYSDKSFAEKRDMAGGFKQSPLRVNEGLGQMSAWNEESIKARAARLARHAASVWPTPKLAGDVLEKYQPKKSHASSYNIENHPHLQSAIVGPMFEALRKEILALDNCVTEEFRKLYVAYKAETNFVDIIPQTKNLLLVLNMRFSDVSDPRGICRNVTGLGRWGNGDVEVKLDNFADMPYVVGLIRQSLEQQLGDGADA